METIRRGSLSACCWKRMLIPPPFLFSLQDNKYVGLHGVRGGFKGVRAWSWSACVKLDVLYGCIWPNADLGTRADGKKRQEAGIFCKVRGVASLMGLQLSYINLNQYFNLRILHLAVYFPCLRTWNNLHHKRVTAFCYLSLHILVLHF